MNEQVKSNTREKKSWKNHHLKIKTIFTLICLMATCVLADDSANKSEFPTPPEAVNAYLSKNISIFFDHVPKDGRADIEFLAYVRDMNEYATVRQGNKLWEKHWYFIKCEIIKKTVGQWIGKELTFVCYDTWPTPESGILVDKPPFPYMKETLSPLCMTPELSIT